MIVLTRGFAEPNQSASSNWPRGNVYPIMFGWGEFVIDGGSRHRSEHPQHNPRAASYIDRILKSRSQ